MNILITGGASGLGEAITRKLADDKQHTVYFTFNKSVENARKITAEYGNTKAIKCDFRDKKELESLIDQMTRMDLDVLINNAYSGSFLKAHFHKTALDDFLTEFQDNLMPTIAITQSCINAFRKKKRGKIITVLTAALLNTPPAGASVYVANKGYLEKLTKVWASENAKYNISSNSVSPALMQTALTSDIDDRIVEQMVQEHPLKKLLTVEETADTVLYLVKASSQLNGVDIVINSATNIK